MMRLFDVLDALPAFEFIGAAIGILVMVAVADRLRWRRAP